jgi:hypothetical protein
MEWKREFHPECHFDRVEHSSILTAATSIVVWLVRRDLRRALAGIRSLVQSEITCSKPIARRTWSRAEWKTLGLRPRLSPPQWRTQPRPGGAFFGSCGGWSGAPVGIEPLKTPVMWTTANPGISIRAMAPVSPTIYISTKSRHWGDARTLGMAPYPRSRRGNSDVGNTARTGRPYGGTGAASMLGQCRATVMGMAGSHGEPTISRTLKRRALPGGRVPL